MHVAFDPDKGVVEVRGEGPSQLWPFNLDCTLGVARIDLGGTTFDVRPLTWRQKRLLARYSSLGAGFVERQFLQLATGGGQIPDGGVDHEVLFVLAKWMNSPADGATTALDSTLLTRVELDVCRALVLRPGDLDQREALDVEAVWKSLVQDVTTGHASSPAVAAPGAPRQTTTLNGAFQRIRVIPDPRADAPSIAAEPQPEESFAQPVKPSVEDIPPAGNPPSPSADVTEALPPVSTRKSTESPSAPSSITRHVLGERAFRWAGARRTSATSPSSRNLARAASPAASSAPVVNEPRTVWQTPEHEIAILPSSAAPAAASQPVMMSAAVPHTEPIAVPVPMAVAVAPARHEIDVDRLFDELGERLEQAAAELGIEVGA